MRQLRFVFIALLASLFVINATFLRKTIAVLLCGILSFNSVSFYSFLNEDGKADAVTPQSRTTKPSQKNQSSKSITIPQYNFNLVERNGLTIDGQQVQGINVTIPWKRHRLIDEAGRVAFQDAYTGALFYDNKAVAYAGQVINNLTIQRVLDYFLFKNGTLDIVVGVGNAQTILIRNGAVPQVLISDNVDSSLKTQGYDDTYYVSHNGHILKNGDTEVAELPKPQVEPEIKRLPNGNMDNCIRNDKNQYVCAGLYAGYLAINNGKYLPGFQKPLAINNNGRIITNFMQVLDYEKDAVSDYAVAIKNSGNLEIERVSEDFHKKNGFVPDLEHPIYANIILPRRIKIPYEKLFGVSNKFLADKIQYLQLTDSGYIAIVLLDPGDIHNGVIIRGIPAGTATKPVGNQKKKQYSCDDFKKGFAPFWSGIQQAATIYTNKKYPIPVSLLAAIAVQETGGGGASFPKNIQEDNSEGFGIGPFQIDFSGAEKLYNGITPAQVFSPDALTQFPNLSRVFKKKGITPQQATDPIASAKLAASILEEGWTRYDDELSALSYYNGGPPGAENPAITTSQNWGGEKKLYAQSVKDHQSLIEEAIKRCGTPEL